MKLTLPSIVMGRNLVPLGDGMRFADFEGISLEVKGDGSDNPLPVTVAGISSNIYYWRYTVYIPVQGTEWQRIRLAWSDFVAPDGFGHHFWVIDDEKEIQSFIKSSFADVFKQIYTADDGKDGLMMVHQYQPDLVICDIMMPRMDGFEFCRLLKSDIQISHIPVILLTARDNPESQQAGYKLGADFYLSKPFDDDVLLAIIRNLLWNREQIKSYYWEAGAVTIVPKDQTFSNADEQFLLKLNKLILDNVGNPELDVKFLTVELGMSRASLYNKVKALTGLGVNDLINRMRIEQAMRLLTETDLTIGDVAEKTGFSNARYFSTSFKQFTTLTPREYREKNKNKGED